MPGSDAPSPSRSGRWREIALAAAVGLALTLTGLRVTPERGTGELAPDLGDPRFTLVMLKWFDHQARMGFPDFASPPFFHPERRTLLLSDHMVGPGAAFFGLRLLGARPILAYNLLVIGSFVAAFVATFWVARRLGSSIAAALVAGAAGAFTAFRWSQLSHFLMIWAPTLPLLLWSWHRFLGEPRPRTALAALGTYAVLVTGGLYLAYMAHLPLLVLAIVTAMRGELAWRDRRARSWLLVTTALAATLAAAVFLPYLEASAAGLRHGTAEVLKRGASLLCFVLPARTTWLWVPALEPWTREEGALLAGYALTALAALGLACGLVRRGPGPRPWPRVAGGALLLGAGLAANEILVWHGRTPVELGGLSLPRVSPRAALVAIALGAALLGTAWHRGFRLGLGRDARERTFWAAALLSSAICLLLCLPAVYLPLSRWIPGLTSMRVPGRFFALCLPVLGWLAARGFDRLGRAPGGGPKRAALAGLCALFVLAETIPRPPRWHRLPEEEAFPAVYRWLREATEIRAYAELPITADARWGWREGAPMYFATLHWKPILNGYSSFLPPAHVARVRRVAGLPLPEKLAELVPLGIDAIVVRRNETDGPARTDRSRRQRLRRIRSWTDRCVEHGATRVYADGAHEVLLLAGVARRPRSLPRRQGGAAARPAGDGGATRHRHSALENSAQIHPARLSLRPRPGRTR